MTASDLARLLHGRRIGKGRWQARCPAHGRDRNPSLTISEGKSAVLLKCWSHDCTPKAICDALGLKFGDLFHERRSYSPEAVRKLEAQRKEEERREAAQRLRKRRSIDQAIYWRTEVERLGKLLMEDPTSDKLSRQFHWACDRYRNAETGVPFAVGIPEPLTEFQELTASIFWSFYEIMPPEEWLAKRREAKERGEEWPVPRKGQDPDYMAQLALRIAHAFVGDADL